ncbi:MAG: hypothetical protein FWB86_03880 [Treponema sp.]|nr:hypothetical protein [Treponema sp.]
MNIPLFAQEEEEKSVLPSVPVKSEEFWFCPSAEIALYSEYSFSYGAGFAIAFGKKTSFGLKGIFFFDEANVLDVLELHILLRLYLFKGTSNNGPFFQLTGGPAIFFPREFEIVLPAQIGMFSACLSFGWRFILGKNFFIEPQVRGGYPFLAGGSVSAGLRF